MEDYPEACRKPIDVRAIEIPYDQIDLSAWESAPGTIDLPQAVRSYIADESNRLFLHFAGLMDNKYWQLPDCPFSISDTVGPIYRVPIDQRFDIFLYRAQGGYGYADNHLIHVDRKNQTISNQVPTVFAGWNDIAYPDDIRGNWIDFEDLDGDGKRELRVTETLHNGTVYNALAYHYFDTGGGALSRELVIEFYTNSGFGGQIERRIIERSANRVLFIAEWFDEDGQLELSQSLPLFRKANGQPFQSRLENLENYRGILTYCEADPNHFFEHGC